MSNLTVPDLVIIRSIANDNLRNLVKPIEMTPEEFTTYCWVRAISARLTLNIIVELPTRWTKLTEIK